MNGRKPDNDKADLPWNSNFKPKLFGRIRKWDEPQYQHEWENGILDTLFDRLEEEVEDTAKRIELE